MMSHGYQVQDKNDPFVATVDEAMEQFAICTAPGAFLANIFPARAFLTALSGSAGPPTDALALPQLLTSPLGSLVPVSVRSQLHGAGLLTRCATSPTNLSSSEWYVTCVHRSIVPFSRFICQAAGTDIPNFTSNNLEGDITPEREHLIKNVAASLYSGGADTVRLASLCAPTHAHVVASLLAVINCHRRCPRSTLSSSR